MTVTVFFGRGNLDLQLTSVTTPRRNSNWLTSLGTQSKTVSYCKSLLQMHLLQLASFCFLITRKTFSWIKVYRYIQKGSMSIIFSNTLLWLYPTISLSYSTSVSLHSILRALKPSTILTFPFLRVVLNPAPKADGASLHQPFVTSQSKCFCFLSLREDGNVPKTSTKLSGYPPNHSFPAKHRKAQWRGSRCAKTIVHHDSHHNLLPSLSWLFVMFLWP